MAINLNLLSLLMNSNIEPEKKPTAYEFNVTMSNGNETTRTQSGRTLEEAQDKVTEFKDTWNTAHPDNQIDKIE